MYFKRFFTNGESFPKKFAVYFCKTCNKEEIYEVTRKDFRPEPKQCPTCHCLDDNDRKVSLIAKRDTLTALMAKTQQELDTINVELVMMIEEPTKGETHVRTTENSF